MANGAVALALVALFITAESRNLNPSNVAEWLSSADETKGGQIWAVLVAGSNEWINYRHQADICHAYHLLVDHGVHKENIITMMYDDIANNTENPYPGKIINHPNGANVYEGVVIDYRGEDVNPANFLAVLEGRANDTGGKKVLKSTDNDRVFVYYTDHGGTGHIGMMNDSVSAYELRNSLQKMHNAGLYKELTFYLEACESGSMFGSKWLEKLHIYAVTSANAYESSMGCYCDTPDIVVCLGDEFSVGWMEDSDREDLSKETLNAQYQIVRKNTESSHVTRFGNQHLWSEKVALFQGGKLPKNGSKKPNTGPADYERWSSRDIPLKTLEARMKRAKDLTTKSNLQAEIDMMKRKRILLKEHVHKLAEKLVQEPENVAKVLTKGTYALTNLECHHEVTRAFTHLCYPVQKNPYAMEYVYVLANLCEHGVTAQNILDEMRNHCENPPVENVR